MTASRSDVTQQPLAPRLMCLGCSAQLHIASSEAFCQECKRAWPVREGIPRFFLPDYYWGEVEQGSARSLIAQARDLGWREAVTRRFVDDPVMLEYVLGHGRASWLPLLGLLSDAVALDLGSGYGAITHSLAKSLGEVYSLEAISERIEFTGERIKQEGFSNVHLIQGTALSLPFFEKSFDLIVVNGVLEWTGEWDQRGNPREIQVQFLQTLGKLLKDNGMLVIGIENRISYQMLRGGIDHSGMSYTSLMPRKLASLCLRRFGGKHYRTALNPKKEYRTYTYSEGGYRKLLHGGGIDSSEFYWAAPGYNDPQFIVPLYGFALRNHVLLGLTEPSEAGRWGWRRRVKQMLAPHLIFRRLVNDFLIFARVSQSASSICQDLLRRFGRSIPGIENPTQCDFSLAVNGKKSVIQIIDKCTGALRCVIKVATPPEDYHAQIRSESDRLAFVNATLSAHGGSNFLVPKSLGSFQIGGWTYAVESAAAGEQFSRLVFRKARRHRLPFLREKLPLCIEAALQLALLLRGGHLTAGIDLRLPMIAESKDADLRNMSERPEGIWIQHGDFTVENIFLDQTTGRLTVIDWEHVAQGLPPLYDVFALLISALPVFGHEPTESAQFEDSWLENFNGAFFSHAESADFYRELLMMACNRLNISWAGAWEMFCSCLALRIRYFELRSPANRRLHSEFMRLALEHSGEFLLTKL